MNHTEDEDVRALDREAAKDLPAGAHHYTAFVGPPEQYDFMGATQFRLLTTLGLREHHSLLDFGCGSLRAGRLLIPYLLPGRYYGVEPNRWLVEDGIAHELGSAVIDLKRPNFRHDDDFSSHRFGVQFDFILAQSIFSHAGRDIVAKALSGFRRCLAQGGLVLSTFIPPEMLGQTAEFATDVWTYPNCVSYRRETVLDFIRAADLVGRELPWFHPRQRWFAMAHSQYDLPSTADDIHLSGAVLRASDLRG
jgi:SAM-dependent methyltransferase